MPVKIDRVFKKLIDCPEIRTKARIAEICEVTPPAINCWKVVPARHARKLELASKGKVTRYEMRPDVFGPGPDDDSDLTAA